MVETFRPAQWLKYFSVLFAALFLGAALFSASLFLSEPPFKIESKGEREDALTRWMGTVVFGTMFLLSIYTLAACYVERLELDGTSLWIRSVFQNHRFDIPDLQRLTWKVIPAGGKIVFKAGRTKSRLDLLGFSKKDRLQIITALRDLVPTQLQVGWPEFCHKVALPLRKIQIPKDLNSPFRRQQA